MIGDPSPAVTYTATRNIVLADMTNGNASCSLFSSLHGNGNAVMIAQHNTIFTYATAGGSTESGIKLLDSTGPGTPSASHRIQANVFWGSPNQYGPKVQSLLANAAQDLITPANCDYNSGWNIRMSAATGSYTNQGGGIAGGGDRGYWSAWSTLPGAHDADVLASTPGMLNPQFVDSTRRLSTWGASPGGGSQSGSGATLVNNTLGYHRGDPTNRVPALLSWVRQGFKVKATGLKNASYPGDSMTVDADGNAWAGGGPTIGAMTYAGGGVPAAAWNGGLPDYTARFFG
jgi:hypothetical protein